MLIPGISMEIVLQFAVSHGHFGQVSVLNWKQEPSSIHSIDKLQNLKFGHENIPRK